MELLDNFQFTGLIAGFIVSSIIWLIILITALIQIFKRSDLETNTKLLWLLIILIFPFLGLLIYVLTNFSRAKNLLWIGLLGIAICAAATVFFVFSREHRDVTKEEAVTITADALYTAFKTNEAEANKKFLDKALALNGEVTAVSTNQDGKIVVEIKTADPFVVINCTFKENPGSLKPGDTITFKGICTGYIPDANVVINEGILVSGQ